MTTPENRSPLASLLGVTATDGSRFPGDPG